MPRENIGWKPNPLCTKQHGLWESPNKMASEYEVSNFLETLVRLTKPFVVVETGTYHGDTTLGIAKALKQNTVGKVTTFEIDPEAAAIARKRIDKSGLGHLVTVVDNPIHESYLGTGPIELAWIDSGMRTRQDDMDVIWPLMAPGGIALVHDASSARPPGHVRPRTKDYQMWQFGTPRGLNAFQKNW